MPQQPGNTNLNICIIARKKLQFNTRIVRQAHSLSERGHKVTVVSLEKPGADQIALTPSVTYIESPLPKPVLIQLLIALFKLPTRFFRKIYKLSVRGVRLCVPHYFYGVSHKGNELLVSIDKRQNGPFIWFKLWVTTILKSLCIIVILLQSSRIYNRSNILKLYTDNSSSSLFRIIILPYLHVFYNYYFKRHATSLLKDASFDLVQAHDSYALPAAVKLCKSTGAALAYDAVEIPDDRSGLALQGMPLWLKKIESRRVAKLVRRADCIMTVGPGVATWMQTRYSMERPLIIRNCRIYEDHFEPSSIRRDVGVDNGDLIVLYINKIYPGQGVEQMLEALAYLPSNVRLATLGPYDEGYTQGLHNIAVELGVADRFCLLEPVTPTELLAYASGADLGIIPMQNTSLNTYNALPNRVFELIMARLPIASSMLPDIKAIVTGYNVGTIFNETDPKDIAKVLSSMLQADRLKQYQDALTIAARELCWENEGLVYAKAIERTMLGLSEATMGANGTRTI